ncbi:adenosine deaminase [Limoniibacter endophyticus]|uniref:Adenine deaminase n=1 Tax=Limoniibacter endophyticus TaxID=1565040 RepID=A0A8J3DNR6_9HYPH|nr:adenosine deaminase [Limoniibacter endophyticus]GHC74702.1 adenine deaminase [Limoniibacter endophyticus]
MTSTENELLNWQLPLAELHCHIDGTTSPALALRQARKYNVDISDVTNGDQFLWGNFSQFLDAYDRIAALFRDEADHKLLTFDYLKQLSEQGTIYSELFISPCHAEQSGLGAEHYVEALSTAAIEAKEAFGIECRFIVTGVRHYGAEKVTAAAKFAATCKAPLITGFGMAGDERFGDIRDYAAAFDIARDAGLGITVHSGEFAGAEEIERTIDSLRPDRLGHGVRAVESERLMKGIAEQGIVLECCPGSNIALGVFPSFEAHPLRLLKDAGCRITVSSDDPPFFKTTLKREYEIAAETHGFTEAELVELTREALCAAFIDARSRERLLSKLP